MASALENLAAMQHLFAPVGQAIGGINAPQVHLAQLAYQQRLAQDKANQEREFIRQRDEFGAQKAYELQNLMANRDDARGDRATVTSITLANMAGARAAEAQGESTKRESERELKQNRDKIRDVYILYARASAAQGKEPKDLKDFGFTEDISAQDLAQVAANIAKEEAKLTGDSHDEIADQLIKNATASKQALDAYLTPDMKRVYGIAVDQLSDKDAKEAIQKKLAENITDQKNLVQGLSASSRASFDSAVGNALEQWIFTKEKAPEYKALVQTASLHDQNLNRAILSNPSIGLRVARRQGASALPNLNSAAGAGSRIPSADEVGGGQGGGVVLTPRPTANHSDPERNIQNIAQAYAGMGGMIPRQPAIQNESLPAFRPLTGYPVLQSLSAIAEPQPAPQELPELNRSTVPHMASGAVESAILAPYRIRAEDSERIWANSAIPDHEKKNWQIKALMDVWRERAGRDSPKERAFTRDSLESLYGFSPFEPN
jgi:hypothetical protein